MNLPSGRDYAEVNVNLSVTGNLTKESIDNSGMEILVLLNFIGK